MLLARRLVNGRERGCLQVVYLALSVVKEQSLSASLVRLEKELFPLYLGHRFATRLRLGGYPRALPRFNTTMASSDFCNAFAPQTSQVPNAAFQTRRPSLPRHAFRAANRLRHIFSASRFMTRWPHGVFEITRRNDKGSLALRLTCL